LKLIEEKCESMAVNQIYHVARCGSTLLSHILASQNVVYNEPTWPDFSVFMNENNQNQNFIIKFCSTYSCEELDLIGNKVFLYRPLAQYLFKLKSIDQIWIQERVWLVESFLYEKNIKNIIDYNPQTELEKFALIWVIYILTMRKKSNVLWIKTNNFFSDIIGTTNKVCSHFGIPEIQNFEIINYNVKKIRKHLKENSEGELLNNKPINLVPFYNFDKTNYGVPKDNGIILTETALNDPEISNIIKDIKTYLPNLEEYFY